MMFRYLGWTERPTSSCGLEKTIATKVVTYDFARQMEGAREVRCSEFAKAIVANM